MLIAIVDDDSSVRKALARVLSTRSFETEMFGSAREFVTSSRLSSFDCLILDQHMPDITGLDLQIHLRRIGVVIPTIVISAHNEAEVRQKCIAAGANSYLVKPIDSNDLVNAINSARAQLKVGGSH
ncbi:MAG TPA: response regulator [Pseudolabrys sp.]|jgi:FixJ family two-component response regulator|nr:response regulator [Pseudolabrys sp.]